MAFCVPFNRLYSRGGVRSEIPQAGESGKASRECRCGIVVSSNDPAVEAVNLGSGSILRSAQQVDGVVGAPDVKLSGDEMVEIEQVLTLQPA